MVQLPRWFRQRANSCNIAVGEEKAEEDGGGKVDEEEPMDN